MILIQSTKKWFSTLDRIINNFYWKNQKPRIALRTLQKYKEQGVLSAPNFQYYLSAQTQHLTKRINNDHHHNSWIQLEQTACKEIPISDLPRFSNTIKKHNLFLNTAIQTTLIAWWKINKITISIIYK